MDSDRVAELSELVESAEDPVDRADREGQMEPESRGSWCSPLDDFENREMWRRILTAHIQPLAVAAD